MTRVVLADHEALLRIGSRTGVESVADRSCRALAIDAESPDPAFTHWSTPSLQAVGAGLLRRQPRVRSEVHHLTAPLRSRGRATDNADLVNLWAGTGHHRARAVPAAEVVRSVATQLR